MFVSQRENHEHKCIINVAQALSDVMWEELKAAEDVQEEHLSLPAACDTFLLMPQMIYVANILSY